MASSIVFVIMCNENPVKVLVDCTEHTALITMYAMRKEQYHKTGSDSMQTFEAYKAEQIWYYKKVEAFTPSHVEQEPEKAKCIHDWTIVMDKGEKVCLCLVCGEKQT